MKDKTHLDIEKLNMYRSQFRKSEIGMKHNTQYLSQYFMTICSSKNEQMRLIFILQEVIKSLQENIKNKNAKRYRL